MLARRIIALSTDKALGKRIATALKAAGGTVDLHTTLDDLGKGELGAALVVLHLDGDLATVAPQLIGRLAPEARVIAILPRSNLAAVVDIMQSSERVAGMLVADELDTRRLSAMATRVLAGDIFGLEKLVPWGTQIHSHLVGDYQEKSLCISQVSEFAELMGVRRKYRESIEQCVDEMLMNALYDAPVDEQGRPIFSEIPTRTRISLRVEQKAIVQYACDGVQFAVAVRDAFGTLERATVLRYLHKCLHNEQQIDRKIGGAGLGLYLMTSSSSEVYFNVLPGVATEAVCVFDLDQPKLHIDAFGFFHERIDAAGRLASGPSRRLPAGTTHPVERRRPQPAPTPRGLIAVLVVAIAAVLGLIAVAAWPRITGGTQYTTAEVHTLPRAAVEVEGKNAGIAGPDGALVVRDLEVGRAYPVVARLDGYEPQTSIIQPRANDPNKVALQLVALAPTVVLDSTPSGATVEIGGKPAGTTPLTLATLAAATSVTATFKKPGYRDASATFDVPRPGKELRLIQPLAIARDLARVSLTSDPPGAQVIQNGQKLAGITTPAQVIVEAGKPVVFELQSPNKVPARIALTGGPGEELARNAVLVDGTAIHIAANFDTARAAVAGAPQCPLQLLPYDCILAPGPYVIELAVPQAPRIARKITVAKTEQDVKFELGTVEAPAGKQVRAGNGPALRRIVLEAGARQVTVVDDTGAHTVTVVVKAGTTVTVAN